ncbi:MAG: pyrroline-5-carboxylate reductase [Acidaminococcaceae bacterium]|jgi:pyrroline-5-carboxylate reductase|nr:pyrroline-5-carboxylate reductase [Acidaminococcaceae bacterium]
MGKIKTLGKVAFIGCGAMGEAILKGILKAGLLTKKDVTVGVPTVGRREYLSKQYGVKCFADNKQAVADVDFVVLAVKPQMAKTVLTPELAQAIPAKATVVSIMSSIDISMIQGMIPDRAVVRVMPNTPLAVGAGMSAIAPDQKTTKDALEAVKNIFGSCGEIVVLEESSMEAVSAISGCGPGYCFVLIDALADAGVMAGLPRNLAIQLAAQTFAGSGKMAIETGIHPAQLRDQVTSPGGTTIAGIHAMELHGVRGAMYDAVQAVLDRSEALKGNK